MLQALGVTAAAKAVYVEMLRRPGLDAAALARTMDCPPERVAAIIAELHELELVRPSWEDGHGVKAVPPEVGVEWLLRRRQTQVRIAQEKIELSGAAAAMVAERAGVAPSSRVPDECTGLDSIRDELERLAATARLQVRVMVPEAAPTAATLEASRPTTRRLVEPGGATADHLPEQHRATLGRGGARPMARLDRGRGAHASGAAATRWHEPSSPAEAPTAQERALLELRLLGETDERVAHKLGVSTRTVGRMTADLMRRLGAQSRFQAGALAVARGWVAVGSAHGEVGSPST